MASKTKSDSFVAFLLSPTTDTDTTDGCTLHCHSAMGSWLVPTFRSVAELGHMNSELTE